MPACDCSTVFCAAANSAASISNVFGRGVSADGSGASFSRWISAVFSATSFTASAWSSRALARISSDSRTAIAAAWSVAASGASSAAAASTFFCAASTLRAACCRAAARLPTSTWSAVTVVTAAGTAAAVFSFASASGRSSAGITGSSLRLPDSISNQVKCRT